MSVRVNLLPEATKQRSRAAQQRLGLIGAMAALVIGVGTVHLVQVRALDSAEQELLAAEQVRAMLESERDDLGIYANLDARLLAAEQRINTAMASEVSMAGVLQDVALVTPPDTGLTALNIVMTPPNPDVPTRTVGSINIAGQTTTGHAPGVERLLLQFGKIAAFEEAYFNASTVDDDGVANFSVDIGVLPSAKTDRYADGLPQEYSR